MRAELSIRLHSTGRGVTMETKTVLLVGVGGQGSLLASKILGHLLLNQGYDVKVSEVHGMSQRGGSVITYVRFGDKVYSPVVDAGEGLIVTPRDIDKYVKDAGKLIAYALNLAFHPSLSVSDVDMFVG